ncbi:MAG: lipopolysaccharide assembly protein LapB [Xanthomonadales bacterium]|nr:lipopolysaccharide assembly protein LapB [Xanthomonadales bacterium]NIN74884.1 lipopolysaccharide assembly protein LapB [Xanthomonadales bacterium]NIO14968.1 lipopolysaccharide assembly protein LapB [Xanthomonadales bacterium]NIP11911.1 lipopolysaccharide assembly protein LapB [Xanthomonadales bacterium]NIP17579.1 lipopolysaccharide assembly protein LapB [Xanthomonadales bacterium]
MTEILLLALIPLAIWLGWWLARSASTRRERKRNRLFSNQYFQGLNYLLNEQPDKAIQVFLEMAEVNKDTVETHMALGSLFRRRGEVDRAIRLHQNIISKHSLDERQRTRALLELGEDYMRAGLFDRAERLFSELIERNVHAPSALWNLLDIYQQEREWQQALNQAARLDRLGTPGMSVYMAHFCCELAEAELAAGKPEAARRHLRQARRHDPESIRAQFIQARIAAHGGDHVSAMECYEQIAALEADYLPDLLDAYFDSARRAGLEARARAQLETWSEAYDGISVVLRKAEFLQEEQGLGAAAAYLARTLSDRPSVRGLDRLMAMKQEGGPDIESGEEVLRTVAQRLLASQSTYQCSHCGFSGQAHNWQCPSCKKWSTVRVIRGVLGE